MYGGKNILRASNEMVMLFFLKKNLLSFLCAGGIPTESRGEAKFGFRRETI
jgi:hypothetical protein